jgi:hypothetical protein
MLSADYRAAKAFMEMRAVDRSNQGSEPKLQGVSLRAPGLGRGHRLLQRLALLLVSSGGRLVQAGLPPHRPASARTRV